MSQQNDGKEEIVWVSCRGDASCGGSQQKITLKQRLGNGHTIIRYRCLKCNKRWSITI